MSRGGSGSGSRNGDGADRVASADANTRHSDDQGEPRNALAKARSVNDDPNRLNYTINAVAAIVDNRTQKLEAELSQTRQELAEMKAMLQVLVDKGEERHGLLRRLID